MATHRTCDACNNEITGRVNQYSYRKHIDIIASGSGHAGSGFMDRDDNPVSGVDVTVDLCNACYNKVVMPSVKVLYAIKKENGLL